ncbi:MAG: hypothetical protein IJ743_00750, partial [Bacilli bacterium]|nr:hypothetical protein [Bacilli bacterium]
MKNNAKLYIVVASSLLLLITIIYQGVYAYFEAEVINTGVRNTSVATKTLSDLQIIDGTTASSNNMIPGESITQTFQVKNDNDISVCFNLNWENVENTFVNTSDLYVRLSDGAKTIPLSLDTFPTANATLASGMKINASTTKNYTLRVGYVNNQDNQVQDMGKKFSGRITGEIAECMPEPSEVTLTKLKTLNTDIKLNESMNNQSGVCPTYNAISKTIAASSTEEDASLLCEAEDDFGTSYYYRGNVTNNYVSFAGFTWRIVRINGDGSIRLIYDGTRAYNSNQYTNEHIGYMYKNDRTSYANTFDVMLNKNAISSVIKGNATTTGSIDYWYKNNIDITIPSSTKKYSDYVTLNTIFCNDKNMLQSSDSFYTTKGYSYYPTI